MKSTGNETSHFLHLHCHPPPPAPRINRFPSRGVNKLPPSESAVPSLSPHQPLPFLLLFLFLLLRPLVRSPRNTRVGLLAEPTIPAEMIDGLFGVFSLSKWRLAAYRFPPLIPMYLFAYVHARGYACKAVDISISVCIWRVGLRDNLRGGKKKRRRN